MDISKAENLFREGKINELASSRQGLLFLKLKSLDRSKYITKFLETKGVEAGTVPSSKRLTRAYNLSPSHEELDLFIRTSYDVERSERKKHEAGLVNELYKLQTFDWGGLHQNSLEKTIVDRYIKKTSKFEDIEKSVETDLYESMRGYVFCSWYNHWSSILIEDIFKDHERILPALGLIKKIDFFMDGKPYDLKVTYLPEGFIARKRKQSLLRPELTLLRQSARALNLPINANLSPAKQLEDLWAKHTEYSETNETVAGIKNYRYEVINEVEKDPTELMRWLYENQGTRRFDASNRFFIVLVNRENFFEGWKMKRSIGLLKEKTNEFLNAGKAVGTNIDFNWDGQTYSVASDMIVISN